MSGCLTPQGAKNEALQVICACLLTKDTVTLHNVPVIRDVLKLIELLQCLGVKVEQLGSHDFRFCAAEVNTDYLYSADFKKKTGNLRGSVMTAGPLLARIGKTVVPQPGGAPMWHTMPKNILSLSKPSNYRANTCSWTKPR